MKEFSEAYKQKFGSPPPNAFAPLGFDSVNLLATAIERAGSIQPDAVRSALANTRDFEGLVGKIAYSPGASQIRRSQSSRSMLVSKRLLGGGCRSVMSNRRTRRRLASALALVRS